MEPLDESRFEPKPVADEWVPAETPPADFALDDTPEAVAEDVAFDLGEEPAMPQTAEEQPAPV